MENNIIINSIFKNDFNNKNVNDLMFNLAKNNLSSYDYSLYTSLELIFSEVFNQNKFDIFNSLKNTNLLINKENIITYYNINNFSFAKNIIIKILNLYINNKMMFEYSFFNNVRFLLPILNFLQIKEFMINDIDKETTTLLINNDYNSNEIKLLNIYNLIVSSYNYLPLTFDYNGCLECSNLYLNKVKVVVKNRFIVRNLYITKKTLFFFKKEFLITFLECVKNIYILEKEYKMISKKEFIKKITYIK